MRDDPFARPDVRALLECVAAGDDDSEAAAAVLADRLAELGLEEVAGVALRWAWVMPDYTIPSRRGTRRWRVGLSAPDGFYVSQVSVSGGLVRRPQGGNASEYNRLAAALALAADRLAARAAAK